MTKAKLINIIDNIIDFLTNGSVIRDNIIYNGHPNFYLKHSKYLDSQLNIHLPYKQKNL